MSKNTRQVPATLRNRAGLVITAVAIAAGLAACGEKESDKPATQVVAHVNKTDITVHQLNQVLQQQRGVKPEQMEEVSRNVLEQLIDQELSMAKAKELELDRDPRVILNLEAARREVLARSYIEHVAQGIPKATDEAIQKYYEGNPALFAQRRIFRLQEIAVAAPEDSLDAFKSQLEISKSAAELANWAKSRGWRVGGGQVTRAAEQLPLTVLPQIAKLKDGEKLMLSDKPPYRALYLLASRSQPASLEQAKPAIEQYLTVDSRRKAVETNIKALRASAKVEYVGKYAENAPVQSTVTTKDAPLDVSLTASGVQVALPESGASTAKISLGDKAGSRAQVNLDKTSQGAQVSLPSAGASSAK